jgi:hypothetical protein
MWSNILLLFNSEMADRHPQFPFLESFWDNKHRTRLIVEEGQVSVDDFFYVFYLFRHYVVAHGLIFLYYCARFLPLAQLLIGGPPMMDSAVLMTLVDRWCPETHMFHLPCGEITVTLQDVVMILGLPIDSTPVCATVSPGGWRDSIGDAIGLRPPDVPAD